MIVKEKFELVYKSTGNVYNVLPLSSGTLKAYEIEKEDKNHLIGLVNTFGRMKPSPLTPIIKDNAHKCIIVKMPEYPLPGFATKSGNPVINLSSIPVTLITDYMPTDIYSLFLYSISLAAFVNKKPFKSGVEVNIANMIFSIFMKIFGKKSGLIGAFKDLIPKLQFLIHLYVKVSMMGEIQRPNLINKVASQFYINTNEMKLDYDFNSVSNFLTAINENNIISISTFKFSSTIVNIAGMASLPMFEDVSRFFSTTLASTIPGNTNFSYYWSKVNPGLFQKLNNIAYTNLKRSV